VHGCGLAPGDDSSRSRPRTPRIRVGARFRVCLRTTQNAEVIIRSGGRGRDRVLRVRACLRATLRLLSAETLALNWCHWVSAALSWSVPSHTELELPPEQQPLRLAPLAPAVTSTTTASLYPQSLPRRSASTSCDVGVRRCGGEGRQIPRRLCSWAPPPQSPPAAVHRCVAACDVGVWPCACESR